MVLRGYKLNKRVFALRFYCVGTFRKVANTNTNKGK